MVHKTYPMTLEGKANLEAELEHLKMVDRPEVIDRIKIARSFGDLSENSEYESAKDEQSKLENRIVEVETMLRFSEIIDADATDIDTDVVALGRTVTFTDEDNEAETYQIVGAAEADPFKGKISNESPIAKGLLGNHTGDDVIIETPGGSMTVKITAIQ